MAVHGTQNTNGSFLEYTPAAVSEEAARQAFTAFPVNNATQAPMSNGEDDENEDLALVSDLSSVMDLLKNAGRTGKVVDLTSNKTFFEGWKGLHNSPDRSTKIKETLKNVFYRNTIVEGAKFKRDAIEIASWYAVVGTKFVHMIAHIWNTDTGNKFVNVICKIGAALIAVVGLVVGAVMALGAALKLAGRLAKVVVASLPALIVLAGLAYGGFAMVGAAIAASAVAIATLKIIGYVSAGIAGALYIKFHVDEHKQMKELKQQVERLQTTLDRMQGTNPTTVDELRLNLAEAPSSFSSASSSSSSPGSYIAPPISSGDESY